VEQVHGIGADAVGGAESTERELGGGSIRQVKRVREILHKVARRRYDGAQDNSPNHVREEKLPHALRELVEAPRVDIG
jgi:hypothetical protein